MQSAKRIRLVVCRCGSVYIKNFIFLIDTEEVGIYIYLYQRMFIAPCVAVALPLDLGANNGNLLKFPKLVYGLTICIVSLYKLPVHRIVQMYN